VHVGRFVVPADLARAVDLVDRRGVDLLAVTGDLIDDLRLIEPTLDALERGRTRPVLAILGNHDKAHESAVVTAVRRRAPRFTLLVNGSVVIPHRGGSVRVVGADYPLDASGGHVLPRPQQDAAMRDFAARAFAGTTPGETIIALSHHPGVLPHRRRARCRADAGEPHAWRSGALRRTAADRRLRLHARAVSPR
jgi:predicted MPP superfamily phosphohydrolase